MRFVVFSEISWQLLDGFLWNLPPTFTSNLRMNCCNFDDPWTSHLAPALKPCSVKEEIQIKQLLPFCFSCLFCWIQPDAFVVAKFLPSGLNMNVRNSERSVNVAFTLVFIQERKPNSNVSVFNVLTQHLLPYLQSTHISAATQRWCLLTHVDWRLWCVGSHRKWRVRVFWCVILCLYSYCLQKHNYDYESALIFGSWQFFIFDLTNTKIVCVILEYLF